MNEKSTDPLVIKQEGITKKAVQSSAWMYGRMLLTNVINLGVMAILARKLLPADFGLVALAQVLLRFLGVIGASGVGEYIIYDRAEGRQERVHAAFWLNTVISFTVVALGLAVLPLLTRFYVEPGLGSLMLLLLIRHPLEQASTVPDALIKKTLDYQKLVIRDTILEILTSLGMVAMALSGFGVLSLVIPGLIAAPLRVIIVLWMARWYPKLPFRLQQWKGIFKYSINVIGASLGNTIIAEGDTLIIGKTLGSTELGFYNLSWQSANLVSRSVTGVVGKLAMPALSAVAYDLQRLRSGFLKMTRILGTISFPLLIGLFVIADKFILTIYGPQWVSSILPMQILIIYALRHAVGSPSSVIYNAVGRPDIGLKFNLGFIPLYLISILVGSRYGIMGVAIGVTFARTLGGFFAFWISSRLINCTFMRLLSEFVQPLGASILMGLVVFAFRSLLHWDQIPQWLELVILVLLGGVTYLLLLRFIFRKLMEDLIVVIEPLSQSLALKLRKFSAMPVAQGDQPS